MAASWRNELRPLGRLAWPVILAEIGWMAMGIVDTPMASGPRGPTIRVSTMPIDIQPISARMTGQARRPSGRSSLRHEAAMRGVVGTAVDIPTIIPSDARWPAVG